MTLITFPTASPFSYNFRCNYLVGESQSPFSFATQTYDWSVAQWEGEVTFETYAYNDRDTQMELRAFISSLNGKLNTFNYGDPEYLIRGQRGIATGTPLVNGGTQSGKNLITDGWTINITGILKAGDYLQLGSGNFAQLYQITSDVDSDGSGNATIPLNRPLLTSPSDDDPIIINNAQGIFRLAENNTGWQGNPSGKSSITLAFKEAL